MISSTCETAPFSQSDRALIGELRQLAATLDRHGLLDTIVARGELLSHDILEASAERRTQQLVAARDRCRMQLQSFERARWRNRLLALTVPFAIGFAATPYVVHLLA